MKIKNLLICSLFALTLASCSKNNGVNIPTDVASSVVIGTDAPPSSGDNSNLLLGNPSGSTKDIVTNSNNYLIDQGYYIESYNASKSEPNWVSWHLDSSDLGSGRDGDFAAFADLPSSFYKVYTSDYTNSGFDRGHNCPSADRNSTTTADNSTFLMTNIIPQAPNNNEGTWANLESYIRTQIKLGNEAYIIMGNYGTGGVGKLSTAVVNTISNGHIGVPSNVWKIAVIIPVGSGDVSRITSSTRVISVDTPNINSISSDWTKYIVTVRDIEAKTGYNLLSALPQSVQDAIETKKDSGI